METAFSILPATRRISALLLFDIRTSINIIPTRNAEAQVCSHTVVTFDHRNDIAMVGLVSDTVAATDLDLGCRSDGIAAMLLFSVSAER